MRLVDLRVQHLEKKGQYGNLTKHERGFLIRFHKKMATELRKEAAELEKEEEK